MIDINQKLSEHFTLAELVHSTTAESRNIKNVPDIDSLNNLKFLVKNVLEPLRIKYGKPIIVSSGYRCIQLNRVIGGAANSQHTSGKAADIHSSSDSLSDNRELFRTILSSGIEFDQLIWEFGNETEPDWIHISYDWKHGNRKQILKATKVNGKTHYRPLIVKL